MSEFFFKKLNDNYLQILFLENNNNLNRSLFFDSYSFIYINNKEVNLKEFDKLYLEDNNFEIVEIRERNDDVFYILLSTHLIIQISISIDGYGEISQSIYLFDKKNENYDSAYSRFANANIYILSKPDSADM